jgi:hypothetical protein
MTQTKSPKFIVNRRTTSKASSTAAGALAVDSQLSGQAVAQSVNESPAFRRPKTIGPKPRYGALQTNTTIESTSVGSSRSPRSNKLALGAESIRGMRRTSIEPKGSKATRNVERLSSLSVE